MSHGGRSSHQGRRHGRGERPRPEQSTDRPPAAELRSSMTENAPSRPTATAAATGDADPPRRASRNAIRASARSGDPVRRSVAVAPRPTARSLRRAPRPLRASGRALRPVAAPRRRGREERDRCSEQEHRAPVEQPDDEPAEQRPDGRAGRHEQSNNPKTAPRRFGRRGLPDERHGGRGDERSADGLQDARRGEDEERRGKSRDDRGGARTRGRRRRTSGGGRTGHRCSRWPATSRRPRPGTG